MPAWAVSFETRVSVTASDIITAAVRVEALAGVIRDIPIPPGVQSRIDALNILRAVRGTTGIEGIELSEDEVEQIIAAPAGTQALAKGREREEREVQNAARVMQFVADVVKDDPATPLTEGLVCRIHELTTEEIDYANNRPGHYREHELTAGNYVPPRTGDEIRTLMSQFIEWFNTGPPRAWPPAVKAIVAHFYVVSIHPYGDGNGRTARAVESFLLYQGKINARGFYSLANFYYRRRDEYIALLDKVRFETEGDLTPFVRFALNGLVSELVNVHQAIVDEVRIMAFRDYARELLMAHGKLGTKSGERMYHFLLGLAGEPTVSVTALRRGGHILSDLYRKVTLKTLSRDLYFLKKNGLIIIDGDEIQANFSLMQEFVP